MRMRKQESTLLVLRVCVNTGNSRGSDTLTKNPLLLKLLSLRAVQESLAKFVLGIC